MTTSTQTKSSEKAKLYRMSTSEHECPWGLKAANLLNERGIDFDDIKLTSKEEADAFKAEYGVQTTPQIFFGSERLGGYTDLAERLEAEVESADYSYTPVVALFSTAALVSTAASLGIGGFMGVSLSMLASLKLMDIDSFTESFSKYDLIAKRFRPYGKGYPFAELLVGLGFLSGVAPVATGIVSLLLGVSGATSVVKAAFIDKMALNCACVGGNSKAPLGIVSFAENAIMAAMGALLILSSFGDRQLETTRAPEPIAPAAVQVEP